MTLSKALLAVKGRKHVLRVMDRCAGDYETEWKPGDSGSVAVAEKKFNAAQQLGMAAYGVKGDDAVAIQEFDPEADAIVMAPALQGG